MIALMFHQSGAWWVVGVVGSLVAIRLVLWALAGYSSMASRAVEDRDYDPADLVSPYFRIPIIGWMMRLGAWMAGIRSKSQDDEAKRTKLPLCSLD